MIRTRHCTTATLLCVFLCAPSIARADALQFSIDSTRSYLTLTIPNFSVEGIAVSITGQNRTNGAPISTLWSASTNTGNTAFVSGTLSTTVGGSLSGKTLSAIQFISGANSLSALNSGNYRPNPAAYNTATSAYVNNSAAAANYGMTIHISLGNQALVSFDNVAYDIGSNPLAASNTVGSGSFSTAGIDAGILNSQLVLQGLSTILESAFPNAIYSLSNTGPNSAGSGSYSYSADDSKLSLVVPLNVPLEFNFAGGFVFDGTLSGQFVATAAVPEPATLILAGLGMTLLAAVARRRRESPTLGSC
ncbi:MAG TPA: PEP-CTERM sorting domain-containing protein [Pirellulales bacterium]|jgi:hypothetical protein